MRRQIVRTALQFPPNAEALSDAGDLLIGGQDISSNFPLCTIVDIFIIRKYWIAVNGLSNTSEMFCYTAKLGSQSNKSRTPFSSKRTLNFVIPPPTKNAEISSAFSYNFRLARVVHIFDSLQLIMSHKQSGPGASATESPVAMCQMF